MNKILKAINLFVALVLATTLFATCQPAAARPFRADATNPGQFVPGQVVVEFNSNDVKTVTAQATALAGTVSAQVVSQYGRLALLGFSQDADVNALSAQLNGQAGVKFAEPNYVWSLSNPVGSGTPAAPTQVTRPGPNGTSYSVPLNTLGALGDVSANVVSTVKPGYPNDPGLWTNWGWSYTGADIVWPNKTASATICELDTGVDYLHPDLKASVIKGFDFVNNDSDPMDDNGNGTKMAGIMVAQMNNNAGIAGISNGKLEAVKVVDAQGLAVSYNVAAGINYCANLSTVKIITLGVNSSVASNAIYTALNIAMNTKGKLVVAAAGDNNSSNDIFPAEWATSNLLAVSAIDDGSTSTYGCRAAYSNYGGQNKVVAPGTKIYTTTPYDKPFYQNYFQGGVPPRYATVSGTAMAAAFASGVAARRWGYKPTEKNWQVGGDLSASSSLVNADGTCWPTEMAGAAVLNVAYQLDRGAAYGFINNATTGLPLTGAQFQLYQGTSQKGSGTELDSTSDYVEAINLPTGTGYTGKVNLSGVTAGSQPAFQQTGNDNPSGTHNTIWGGTWTNFGITYVPNKGGNFDAVAAWGQDYYAVTGKDLDLDVWLPSAPNSLDSTQPAPFIISHWVIEGNTFGFQEGQPDGSLMGFPFAINNRDGGTIDGLSMESTTISKRLAHAPLAANSNLPYYPGTYYIGVTDYGQLFPSGLHAGDHILYWTYPYVYIWKDGTIKAFEENGNCNTPLWLPFTITSGTSGSAPTITYLNECTSSTPYALGFSALSSQATPH